MAQTLPFQLWRCSSDQIIGNVSALQLFLNQCKHACKLREYKHFVAAIHRTFNEFHACIKLGRALGIIRGNQSWITADLPQLCQLGKNLQLVLTVTIL